MKKGDLLYWADKSGKVKHATIITSNKKKLLYGGHSNPRYNTDVQKKFGEKLFIVLLKNKICVPYDVRSKDRR